MANEDLKSIGKSAGIIASVIAVAALLKNKFKTPTPCTCFKNTGRAP